MKLQFDANQQFQTADGSAAIQLRVSEGTVWLTQLALAELFQTTKQNMGMHARNILSEGELEATAVQRVCELYATAVDYEPRSEAAQLFFKKVQNQVLWPPIRRGQMVDRPIANWTYTKCVL